MTDHPVDAPEPAGPGPDDEGFWLPVDSTIRQGVMPEDALDGLIRATVPAAEVVDITGTWWDFADQLTAEQVASMKKSENWLRNVSDRKQVDAMHYAQARYTADCNAIDAQYGDVPLPDGATTDGSGWGLNSNTGQWNRPVEWAAFSKPANGVDVHVDGMQGVDGTYTCDVSLYAEDCKLTAVEARAVAAALLAAADHLDVLDAGRPPSAESCNAERDDQ